MLYSKILIATQNRGKTKEFLKLLKSNGICEECLSLNLFTTEQAEEPFTTFMENALHKARLASKISGLPTLADDSGLIVPALNGEPGVFSARYATNQGLATETNDILNNQCLLSKLSSVSDRRAFYFCSLVLIDNLETSCPIVVDACWHGEILTEPRGTNGFGYDSLFYLPEIKKTVAELQNDQKNLLSHRAKAVKELHSKLEKRKASSNSIIT